MWNISSICVFALSAGLLRSVCDSDADSVGGVFLCAPHHLQSEWLAGTGEGGLLLAVGPLDCHHPSRHLLPMERLIRHTSHCQGHTISSCLLHFLVELGQIIMKIIIPYLSWRTGTIRSRNVLARNSYLNFMSKPSPGWGERPKPALIRPSRLKSVLIRQT